MFQEYEENIPFNYFQITGGEQERSHVDCLWSAKVGNSEFAEGMDGTLALQQGFGSCWKCWLKMRVGAWLLWVSWFYTWAEYSQRCKCQDIRPTETGLNKGSKSRVKEHIRHGFGHQHTPHRNRPHRRKGEPTTRPALITCCMFCHARSVHVVVQVKMQQVDF